ncbi:uncharacterized protein LOC124885569 [Capsicum annuum]|uniref:uncharacterized protein LOC124885569 n=1 Tax=Capsicum annuum TaxID=4072 RepID=UPI001FB0F229|nr:uncharacterized protein LOC124885569 [Capsicum annuum]
MSTASTPPREPSPDILLRSKRKRKNITAKPSKSFSSPKPSSSSISTVKVTTGQGSTSSKLSPKSTSHPKKQVPHPGSSDPSDSDSDYLPDTPPVPFTSIDSDDDIYVDTAADKTSQLDHVLHFQKRKMIRGKVVTGFGGPDMDTLVSKLTAQGWSSLFLQGDHQRRFGKNEVYEFYTNGVAIREMISTTVHGKTINLYPADMGRFLSWMVGVIM